MYEDKTSSYQRMHRRHKIAASVGSVLCDSCGHFPVCNLCIWPTVTAARGPPTTTERRSKRFVGAAAAPVTGTASARQRR